MNNEQAKRQVREAARTAAYHKGPAMTYEDIKAMCTPEMSPRFICEQAELAGFPVWTSAPEEALTDLRTRRSALAAEYRSCPDAARRAVLLTELEACLQKLPEKP